MVYILHIYSVHTCKCDIINARNQVETSVHKCDIINDRNQVETSVHKCDIINDILH